MSEPRSQPDKPPTPVASGLQPFTADVDETLVDLMLEQTISDRLRSLCHYVNALARFGPV